MEHRKCSVTPIRNTKSFLDRLLLMHAVTVLLLFVAGLDIGMLSIDYGTI
jgi:hypothetical protein